MQVQTDLDNAVDDDENARQLERLADLRQRADCTQLYVAVASDFLVREPAMRWARLHSTAGGKVHAFSFGAVLPWTLQGSDAWSMEFEHLQSCHGTQLPYLLGTLAALGLDTPQARHLSTQLMAVLSAYAYSGTPGAVGWVPQGRAKPSLGQWPPYTAHKRQCLVIDRAGQAKAQQLLVESLEPLWSACHSKLSS